MTENNKKGVLPQKFNIEVLLPSYVIEELKYLAQFHGATLEEEVIRALLQYHARGMTDLINGKLK